MKKIIARLCAYNQKYKIYTQPEEAKLHIRADGTFDDVDYTCESRSGWSISGHLRYAASLALAYDETKDSEYAKLANDALADWAKKDYINSNWWHNDIGVPRMLMHTAIFLGDAIEKSNLDYVLSRLPDTVEARWTGANKSWLAENVICKGLLLGNAAMVREGTDIIKSTIFISPRGVEGVQQDYSFTQHGVQLYNHGYGLSFVNNSLTWGYVLFGSEFALTQEQLDVLTDLVLEGTYRMFRNNAMDFHPRSREIVRGIIGQPGWMNAHVPSLEILLELVKDAEKHTMLEQVYNHIKNGDRMPLLEGNNMYWCVDYMTHAQKHYYASVRWASEGVLGGDMQGGTPVNMENLLAGFAAYGGTCYMVSGKEYENILPVWDWGLLPGTTTPHVELPIEIGGVHESTFVGGVSDGGCGVIAADMHKSYDFEEKARFGGRCASFMFADIIVHLGNSCDSTAKQSMNTCYNQCLLNGDIYVDGTAVKEKYFTDKIVDSVYHGSIAYYNLDGSALSMDAGEKTGDWYRIYSASNVPEDKVSMDVFLLYKPHKKQNSSYAYAVLPGVDVETYQKYDVTAHVQILENADVQAVYNYDEDVTGAVFYTPGKFTCAGVEVCVDAPCMLLYDFKKECISITAPQPEKESIGVRIGEKCARIKVPTDAELRGKTVSFTF